MIEFLLWCLPLVFLAIAVEVNLLSFLYDPFAPVSSSFFVTAATAVVLFISGALYFAVTQFMMFGYVETRTFELASLNSSHDRVAIYVKTHPNGDHVIATVSDENEVYQDTVLASDIKVIERDTIKPRVSCKRFATRFPRIFSGEFEHPHDGAQCVVYVPKGSILRYAGG